MTTGKSNPSLMDQIFEGPDSLMGQIFDGPTSIMGKIFGDGKPRASRRKRINLKLTPGHLGELLAGSTLKFKANNVDIYVTPAGENG